MEPVTDKLGKPRLELPDQVVRGRRRHLLSRHADDLAAAGLPVGAGIDLLKRAEKRSDLAELLAGRPRCAVHLDHGDLLGTGRLVAGEHDDLTELLAHRS